MRFFRSYFLAFLIVLGIGLWMISGTLIEGGQGEGQGEQPLVEAVDGNDGPLRGFLETIGVIQPEEEAEAEVVAVVEEEQAPVQSVRIRGFQAQEMPVVVNLRGRTQANAVIASRAETNGTVQEVNFTKGQSVEAGDLLCTLDQGTRQVRLTTAEAQLEQARADLENNQQLRERGVAPANSGRQFEVALRSAEANYDEALAELERTEIHAEVSGIIQDPLATVGDSLSAGGECATIVQLDPMLFMGDIAEARVGTLAPGEEATITTVTGQEVTGTVRYVASRANEQTRTFAIEIEMANSDGAIRDGVTAEAVVQLPAIQAHLIPQSVLTLDAEGVMGVNAVEGDVVAFYPVQIVRDTREGVWVTGLPETTDIITVGQEYVQTGQTVTATREGEGA
ncbi:efflux RND transporter periplasmic adaptor subunit [Pelagibacterium montanilacus]|uniref:efflux RND transporter periplasmic adaptor subunit n=1 Tax=Pelagibacterium montanilacus TaxID=2185280 RepID=UPI000F8D10A9|nr:efflux RND transporter periplasmic adaptor subunit [Pelagibacterium montanilacus]